MNTTRSVWRSTHVFGLLCLLGALLLTACGSNQQSQGNGPITITLAGPNQWNSSGKSFGAGWDAAVQQFEKLNPNVKVKITVLPLSNFSQIEATELASGSAPDLIFNQTSYKPYQVTPLDSYLQQPNPYAPEKAHWMDLFDSRAYNQTISSAADGHLYWVPLNLVSVGLFVNQDLFQKAGVPFPIKTYKDWEAALQKFKAAGITPMAMDNSQIGIAFPVGSILNQMMNKYYNDFNWFDASGKPGTYSTLTTKDLVRAVKTGKLNANLPEVVEALKLAKDMYSTGATPTGQVSKVYPVRV
ncbi:ABC transporter substrate-binding protein [Dictyobacter kobayashii]|uniref:ABC transporter substrate-binding protein n=1 Tax=Dictyobacter kobayashii TaxID=2014872 RepID=A0A402ARZ6_9CHLR|nr:extracellular solute-binding protein [Dictyobacter kobayashii]GCE21866.1 hypothetical protein KDK_56660 [Dictyobacter kobayashii]